MTTPPPARGRRRIREAEPSARGRGGGAEAVRPSTGPGWASKREGTLEENTDPNIGTWRYVYNEAGDLVGTSDARGCGVNYAYDAAGRLASEDYSPCADHHELYDLEAEVTYLYDFEPGGKGRLGGVLDRGASSYTHYDLRGRVVEVERSINAPNGSTTVQSFSKTTGYDAADRPVSESTGASDGTTVTTSYTRRGAVGRVETYTEKPLKTDPVPLVAGVKRDPDGLVTEIRYGDPTGTRTAFDYDDLRRLRNLTTYRAELNQETPPGQQTPPWHALLQDEQYIYDKVGNPVEIRDWRSENEWDPGFKPVSRKMVYDDLYRLTRIDYQYHPTGSDDWVDPYAAEFSDNTRPQPPVHEYRSNPKRVMKQSWSYDWLGNTTASTDDANLFYDRSLGDIGNTGYRLTSASLPKIEKPSHTIEAAYDPAGYMRSMTVARPETLCAVDKACPVQTYEYQWDEVGRLTKATRKDGAVQAAELTYAYDASDNRVRKSVKVGEDWRHTIYVFGSLELRSTDFTESGYTVDPSTEVPYLFGHGVRLARVTYIGATAFTDERRRVFLELGDHLGSTSVVMDRATGELVERSTAYAYGAAESNYRPGDWYEFREDYRFTGKEDDIEVGLIYFGARYLNPQLGRWISADPLAVHAPGKADLNLYAYVHGKVLVAVDLVGLDESYAFKEWWSKVTMMEGGGYHNTKNDLGGPTNNGITINTCQRLVPGCTVDSLKAMSGSQIRSLAYGLFRGPYRGDDYSSTGVAVFMADVPWGGTNPAIISRALRRVGIEHQAAYDQPAGRLTNGTVDAINRANPRQFLYAYFDELRQDRIRASEPESQRGFRDGWLNRVNTRYVQASILIGEAGDAARWLNGRSQKEMTAVLAWLTPSEKASLHAAALESDSGLGPGSNIASATAGYARERIGTTTVEQPAAPAEGDKK